MTAKGRRARREAIKIRKARRGPTDFHGLTQIKNVVGAILFLSVLICENLWGKLRLFFALFAPSRSSSVLFSLEKSKGPEVDLDADVFLYRFSSSN